MAIRLSWTDFRNQKEIYIYDIRVTQMASPGASASPSPEIPLPKPYQPTVPPNELSDQRSLQSWQDLFKMRRDWALGTADDCRLDLARGWRPRPMHGGAYT